MSGRSRLSRRLKTALQGVHQRRHGVFWRVVDEQMCGVDLPVPLDYLGEALASKICFYVGRVTSPGGRNTMVVCVAYFFGEVGDGWPLTMGEQKANICVAALAAQGRRVVVVNGAEWTDDLPCEL